MCPKSWPSTVAPALGAITDVNLIQYLGVACGPLNPLDTDLVDRAARLVGIVYGDAGQILQLVPADGLAPGNSLSIAGFNFVFNGATWDMVREGASAGSVLTDPADRATRLLGVIYGNQGPIQQNAGTLELISDPVDRATRLVGVIYGSEGQPLYQDPVEPAVVKISFPHHEIHEGNHYTVAVLDLAVNPGAPKYVMIRAPDSATRLHFVGFVSASAASLVGFYENPTVTLDGNPLAELNNDRNSPNIADAACFEDPTIAVDGTLLFAMRVGGVGTGNRPIAGEAGTRQEWILDQAEDYIIKVTPDNVGTEVTIDLTWYEV